MNLIEDLTGPILKGIDWLTGGLANISKVLSNVSALARKIFAFLDCDALKFDKPSEWVSSRNKALKKKTDSWKKIHTGIRRGVPASIILPDGKILIVSG